MFFFSMFNFLNNHHSYSKDGIIFCLETEAMSKTSTSKAQPSTSNHETGLDAKKSSLYPFIDYYYNDDGDDDERQDVSTQLVHAIVSCDKEQRLSQDGDEIQVGGKKFKRDQVEKAYYNLDLLLNFGSAMEHVVSLHPSLKNNLKSRVFKLYERESEDEVNDRVNDYVSKLYNSIDVNKQVEGVTKGISQLIMFFENQILCEKSPTIFNEDSNEESTSEQDISGKGNLYLEGMQTILDLLKQSPNDLSLQRKFVTMFNYNLLARKDNNNVYTFNADASANLERCMRDVFSNIRQVHKAQYFGKINDAINNLTLAVKMGKTFINMYGTNMSDDFKNNITNEINKCLVGQQNFLKLFENFYMRNAEEKQQLENELKKLNKKKHSKVFQAIANVVDKISI